MSEGGIDEGNEIRRASELIRLGARLQLLESETKLSRERLLRLYKEMMGKSPPKGMLPFSTEQGVKGMPQRQKMTITKIELNVPIDDSRFALPTATATASDTTKTAPKADAAAAGDEKAGDKAVTDAKADPKADAGKKADAAKKADAKAAKSKKKKDQ